MKNKLYRCLGIVILALATMGSATIKSPLMHAAATGQTEMLQALLAKGANVNEKDNNGWTSLIHAAWEGHADTVKVLLSAGADVDTKDSEGWTALTRAVFKGSIETTKLLIEKGADVNAVDKNGLSVLVATELMPFEHRVEIAKLLIERGANVNYKNENGWTALMQAARGHSYARQSYIDKGYKDVALVPTEFSKLLIANGADVNAKDKFGNTALMIAAGNGQVETVKLLMEKGADVNAYDINGYTVLMNLIGGYASLLEHLSKNKQMDLAKVVEPIAIEIANLLINAGADVNAKNRKGVTALLMAAHPGITEIVRLLIKKGADVNAKIDGLTAYSYAAANQHIETAKLLKEAGGGLSSDPVFSLMERRRFQGFSILPPQSNHWTVFDSDAKGITFRRNTYKKLHTIYASARIEEHKDLTIKSGTEFLQYVKGKVEEDFKGARFKPIDIKFSLECYQDKDCVRYDFTVEDHGAPSAPGSVLILTAYGFYLFHPDDPKYIVNISYSQRFPKGDKPLPIEVELEPFFKNLLLTTIK